MAETYGKTPSEWFALSHEDRLVMCTNVYGMSNIRAMRDHDDNEKRKAESKANSSRKGRR